MRTTMTPIMAMEILSKNTHNRPMNRTNLAFLEKEIKGDRFIFNGSSIVIAKDGTLLDGQHRLQAVVNTGINIDIVVVTNVDNSAFKTIDTGRARRPADVFAIEGIKYAGVKSSAIKAIMEKFLQNRDAARTKISNEVLLDFYLSHKVEIDNITELIFPLYDKHKIITASFAISLTFLLSRIDSRAYSFIRQIYTGVQESDSILPMLIRDKFIQDAFSRVSNITTETKKNMIVNGFRHYCRGENATRLFPSIYAKAEL